MHLRSLLAAAVFLSASVAAHATSFAVSVSEGLGPSSGFDAKNASPYSGANTANATFTYSNVGFTTPTYNLLNFFNNAGQNGPGTTGDLNSAWFQTGSISNYSGSGTVTYNSTQVANYGGTATGTQTTPATSAAGLLNFLNSSGSASNYAYDSFYTFNLGTLYAGTTLTINHDDGVALFLGSTQVCGSSLTSTPTSVLLQTCNLTASGNYTLQYGRENGTPSILQVNAQTPEPSSLALLGTGLLGIAGAVRRRIRA